MIAMTGTRRYVLRMAVFLAAAAGLAIVLVPVLGPAFRHNPGLNGTIIAVLAFGVAFVFRQVLMLRPEIAWLERYRSGRDPDSVPEVRLLAPMATMLGERSGRPSLSAATLRSLLDSIAARLDEGRDIARYLIGLLILLGLLGTFWGLIQTVGSVGDVVGRLSFSGTDAVEAFDALKRGLATPLAGMGTAFSSSLFGLAGSLMLGFLDLQAGAAQNRFYNELEEYLATLTRVGGAGTLAEGDTAVPAYVGALLEQTADSLDQLRRLIARAEERADTTGTHLQALAERMSELTEHLRGDAALGHLRTIEIYLGRVIEDGTRGRDEMLAELRAEIRLLARTLAAVADERGR